MSLNHDTENDDQLVFVFGRPARAVRGLRLLGVVVHKSRVEDGAIDGNEHVREDSGDGMRDGLGALGVGEQPFTFLFITILLPFKT